MTTGTRPIAFTAALATVADIEGWMTDAQARRLWGAAAATPPPDGRVVEIGSFRGRSTIVLALAAPEEVELVAVDPHMGGDRGPNEYEPDADLGEADHRAFHANLERAGVEGRVRHVRRLSQEALSEVPGDIDVLYIDGAHRFAFARPDIQRWGVRVRDGGTMLIHDSFNAVGVMLAQLLVLFPSARFRYVGRSGSLAEYRRKNLTGRERVDNALRQAGALPYFVRNCIMKMLIVARLRPLARLLGERGHWPY
jgi:predicted O-methyltransferase YrrM